MVELPMMVRAQCHQVAQLVHGRDRIGGQEIVDGFDVANLVVRVVAAHGAGLGPARFAIGGAGRLRIWAAYCCKALARSFCNGMVRQSTKPGLQLSQVVRRASSWVPQCLQWRAMRLRLGNRLPFTRLTQEREQYFALVVATPQCRQ